MLSALISIFYLCICYCSLELKKNIVRFSHENIRIFKEFRSIVNMLRALILLTRKCHNIIKHSFNENIKELDYLLISYFYTFHTPHFPHPAFSTLLIFHTPHSAFSTEPGMDGNFDDCTKEVLKELEDDDSDTDEEVQSNTDSEI